MAELSTLARPYARAFFEIKQAAGDLASGSRAVDALAAVASEPQIARLTGHPAVRREELVELISAACGDALDDAGRNLLRLLVANGRVAVAPKLAEIYGDLRAEAESTITVDVTAAMDVAAATREALAGALAKRLGRTVDLNVSVDETLIGGAVLRAGDLVIDGSVAGRVARMTRTLTA